MRAEIIKIGNSKGLRIPKPILEQCRLKDIVDLRIENHSLIITSYNEHRTGWEKDFQLMAEKEDDTLLVSDSIAHSWDDEKWQW